MSVTSWSTHMALQASDAARSEPANPRERMICMMRRRPGARRAGSCGRPTPAGNSRSMASTAISAPLRRSRASRRPRMSSRPGASDRSSRAAAASEAGSSRAERRKPCATQAAIASGWSPAIGAATHGVRCARACSNRLPPLITATRASRSSPISWPLARDPSTCRPVDSPAVASKRAPMTATTGSPQVRAISRAAA